MAEAQHRADGSSMSDSTWSLVDSVAPVESVDAGKPTTPTLALSTEAELSHYAAGCAPCLSAIVSLAAAGSADESRRAPTSLSSVIDRSGSMAGRKLELVTSTAKFMSTQLSKQDRLGIVVYDDQVDEVMPLLRMSSTNKATAAATLDRVHTGGCTNLSGGLFRGISQQIAACNVDTPSGADAGVPAAPDGSGSPSTHAVFLLTDGLPNRGVCDHDQLATMLSSMLEDARRMHGVQLRVSTFGFGSDADPELLGKLADVGGGSYFFIESPEQVPDVFGEALGGLLSTCCQNVEVTIMPTPGSGVELLAVRSPYKTEAMPGGGFKVHIGDMYEEEQKDLVVQLKAPSHGLPSPAADSAEGRQRQQQQSLMVVNVRYMDLVTGKMAQASTTLSIQRPEAVAEAEQTVSELVRYHVSRLETVAALEAAQREADAGNLIAGRKRLEEVLGVLQSSLKAEAATMSAEITRKLGMLEMDVRLAAEKYTDDQTYRREGKARSYMMSKAHFVQRSAGVVAGGGMDNMAEGGMPMQYQSSYATSKQKSRRAEARAASISMPLPRSAPMPMQQQRAAPDQAGHLQGSFHGEQNVLPEHDVAQLAMNAEPNRNTKYWPAFRSLFSRQAAGTDPMQQTPSSPINQQ